MNALLAVEMPLVASAKPVSDPNPYYAGDELLIREFVHSVKLAQGDWVFGDRIPRSQLEAVVRRLDIGDFANF